MDDWAVRIIIAFMVCVALIVCVNILADAGAFR